MVELDLRTWRGTWLGAGHRAPLRITADATSALPTVPCLPLGMTIAGQRAQPELQPVALDEGDMLVLYSDGVIDNLRGPDAADDAPAEAAFHAALRTDPGASHRARSVVESLLARSSELRDDATLLLASRRP